MLLTLLQLNLTGAAASNLSAGGVGGKASSGRWVQVGDRSTVFVDIRNARAVARTVALAIEAVSACVLVAARAMARTAPMGAIARDDTMELLAVIDLVARRERKPRANRDDTADLVAILSQLDRKRRRA